MIVSLSQALYGASFFVFFFVKVTVCFSVVSVVDVLVQTKSDQNPITPTAR